MPSIGKDLVKIRKHLGLTLQDIQFATKLPQHTLEKIEDDTIFVDAEEGPIYTRNFVRSYGRVLKIDDDLMIEALNHREAGKYNHELFRDFPELSESPPEKRETSESSDPDASTAPQDQKKTENEAGSPVKKDAQSNDSEDDTQSKPEPEPEPESKPDPQPEPEPQPQPQPEPDRPKKSPASSEKNTSEVDWAKFGQKIHQEKKQVPAWIIGLIILAVVLGVAGYFVFRSGVFSSEDSPREDMTMPANEAAGNTLSIELDEPQQRPQPELSAQAQTTPEPAVILGDTLDIVVYAAFGNVDPVRVWSDTKPRFDPYWIEEGNAMTFDFVDTVQVRGPYDNMLVFLNGHLIENMVQSFYSDEGDYVELNRSDFTSDTKWSETTDLQVPEGVDPPLEIRSRPTFN